MQSRFIIASIFAVSENALFRKYHAPAYVRVEAPKAMKMTERFSEKELCDSIPASSSIIARPEALPFAP